jgi:hypothetical protein
MAFQSRHCRAYPDGTVDRSFSTGRPVSLRRAGPAGDTGWFVVIARISAGSKAAMPGVGRLSRMAVVLLFGHGRFRVSRVSGSNNAHRNSRLVRRCVDWRYL